MTTMIDTANNTYYHRLLPVTGGRVESRDLENLLLTSLLKLKYHPPD